MIVARRVVVAGGHHQGFVNGRGGEKSGRAPTTDPAGQGGRRPAAADGPIFTFLVLSHYQRRCRDELVEVAAAIVRLLASTRPMFVFNTCVYFFMFLVCCII